MPNGDDIQRSLTQPLAVLEDLLRTQTEAICQRVQQMNVTAQRFLLQHNGDGDRAKQS